MVSEMSTVQTLRSDDSYACAPESRLIYAIPNCTKSFRNTDLRSGGWTQVMPTGSGESNCLSKTDNHVFRPPNGNK